MTKKVPPISYTAENQPLPQRYLGKQIQKYPVCKSIYKKHKELQDKVEDFLLVNRLKTKKPTIWVDSDSSHSKPYEIFILNEEDPDHMNV